MPWIQKKDADMTVGYVGGWCLKYVQDAFKTDHPYPTAMAAWNGEPVVSSHGERPPLGVTVPVYFSLGTEPAGHVAIALSDGWVASSTLGGSHARPYFHKSIDDLIAVYGKYNGGCTYLGWGEHVGSTRVVEYAPDNATDDQIRQAYLDILERPADDSGIAHYRNYTNDFVRQDLLNSDERKHLLALKAAQAQAAAEQQAKAEAQARADAEAKAKAEADEKARQEAIAKQPVVVTPAPSYTEADRAQAQETNNLIKQILEIVKSILTKLTGVFK